jgi:hypothetical protein
VFLGWLWSQLILSGHLLVAPLNQGLFLYAVVLSVRKFHTTFQLAVRELCFHCILFLNIFLLGAPQKNIFVGDLILLIR